MKSLIGWLAGAMLLAGCATTQSPPTGLPARSNIVDFELEARFALRTERPNEASQTASGRLNWHHGAERNRILLADPLGQGLAEIESGPAGASLRSSNGQIRQSADAASLLRETTGYSLPLGELPAWLLGRPTAGGRLASDPQGRPLRLFDGGWRIDYSYDDESADALPSRVTISREGELELRLRIEEWRAAP